MTKLIDTLNNLVKLVSSLATLAVLGGVVFVGLWVYHKVGELTSKPIQVPDIVLPSVKMPEKIKLPEIVLPEVKVQLPNLRSMLGLQKEPEHEVMKPEDWKFKDQFGGMPEPADLNAPYEPHICILEPNECRTVAQHNRRYNK